ncbi:Rad52/Rad22 family DNA repair protein [Limnoglobus roseus]|uniref:Single-stranded DNA-binding protein DdrA n=1 Tax=Limnoglobus roseus TaxID=2598579 RepID=A0A5C1AF30_9BACT|nr:Rad52/Rad22 family DNA repair protein [Limnoglobus roseus]QEL17165.1 Single-stranded DNA-binding protein DdrA [Limnoglobus roseus]
MTNSVKAITEALSAPFDHKEVKFKPQVVKGNRAMALAYIDARMIEDRLDDVLGVAGWQDEYETLADGSVVCRLRLKIDGEWVTKMDVGSPSEQPDGGDRMKAAFSDALKRAAVKFGIGRYLYRLPVTWAEYDPMKKQFTQAPQLPAFALPKPKAKSKEEPSKSALPADGQELHQRLKDYDAKLAAQKLCNVGSLLTFVAQAGEEAGFGPDLTTWAGPAIPLAVAKVKEFETQLRAMKPGQKSVA